MPKGVQPLLDAIYRIRAKRNAAAGVVRMALVEAEKQIGHSPNKMALHEIKCLSQALKLLVETAPLDTVSGVDAEIEKSIKLSLDEVLGLRK